MLIKLVMLVSLVWWLDSGMVFVIRKLFGLGEIISKVVMVIKVKIVFIFMLIFY